MKLTKSQIKQIIKEELEQVMKEIEGLDEEEVVQEEEGDLGFDREAAIAELNAKMAEPMTPRRKQ